MNLGGSIALEQGTLHYYPEFLTQPQAKFYYQQLVETLAWRQDKIKMFGKLVAIPRAQAWYGDSQAKYTYSGLLMSPHPWTETLTELRQMCQMQCHTSFNSVLANWYRNGQDKMGYHSDNEKELGNKPTIASLSLGCTRRFVLKHKHSDEKISLDLPSGSLLMMAGQTQEYYKHAIMAAKNVTEGRVNLTFRYIYR